MVRATGIVYAPLSLEPVILQTMLEKYLLTWALLLQHPNDEADRLSTD